MEQSLQALSKHERLDAWTSRIPELWIAIAAEIIPGTACTARMCRQLRRNDASDEVFRGCSGYRPNEKR